MVVDRLRGTQSVRGVPEDQRQNQHTRRRTARVSIRVENCYCNMTSACKCFESHCYRLQQVAVLGVDAV